MKKIIIVIVLIALGVWGYTAFSKKSSEPTTPTDTTIGGAIIEEETKTPVVETVKADPKVIDSIKNASVTASEDGKKVSLVNGKAEFSVEGGAKATVSLGEVAIEKMFGSRKDVLAVVNVNQGEKGTLQYLVLIDVKTSGAVEKSIVFLGTNVDVKSIVATDLGSKTGEEYVAVVTILDRKAGEAITAKPTVQKTLIFTVEKGVFNIEKSISI